MKNSLNSFKSYGILNFNNFWYYIAVLFLPLGLLAKVNFVIFPVEVYAIELLLYPYIIISILKQKLYRSSEFILVLCFAFLLLTVTWIQDSSIHFLLSATLLIGRITALFLLAFVARLPLQISKFTLLSIIFWSIITSGILQFLFLPSLTALLPLGYDAHWGRLFGVFFDTNITALIATLAYVFLLARDNFPYRNIFLLLFALVLLFTFSRSMMLLFLLTNLIYWRKKFTISQLALFLVIIVFIFILLSQKFSTNGILRTHSIQSRMYEYQVATHLFQANPWFGSGVQAVALYRKNNQQLTNAFGSYNHSRNYLASSFASILVWGGLIGLLLFGYLFAKLMFKSEYLLLFFVFLLSGFFDNNILHPITWIFYLCLTAYEKE